MNMIKLLSDQMQKNDHSIPHATLSKFPVGLLKNPGLAASGVLQSESRTRIKHSFIMSVHEFNDTLLPYFIEVKEAEYIENFVDDSNWELLRKSIWTKVVFTTQVTDNCTEVSFRGVSMKHTKPNTKQDISAPYLEYKEKRIQLDKIIGEHLLLHGEKSIKLLVQRKEFQHKDNADIKLTFDQVEFPDGDLHSVFSIYADVDHSKIVSLLAEKDPSLQQISSIIKPCRSKVIEYLFRYERGLYNELVETGWIPRTTYYSRLCFLFKEAHSQSISRKPFEEYHSSTKAMDRWAPSSKSKVSSFEYADDPDDFCEQTSDQAHMPEFDDDSDHYDDDGNWIGPEPVNE